MTSQESPACGREDAEFFVAVQDYTASSADEINLKKGDVVEVLEMCDASAVKKPRLDPALDDESLAGSGLLDTSAARHKLSVRPRRTHRDSRQTSTNPNTRWQVRVVQEAGTMGEQREGWVPSVLFKPADESFIEGAPPPDASYRREAVVRELIDTEEEFCKDLQDVLEHYYHPIATTGAGAAVAATTKPPRCVRDNHELVFGNLKQITDFHNTVLMEGVKYYASEPVMLGRVFLRLERDFDKHVAYCRDEPLAQHFLQNNLEAKDYFEEVSQRLADEKTLSEHLKLPIQRINDYQLLLKELVKYTCWLQEDATYLQRALELMLSVPHRASDDKFTSNIEGFRGSIYKLGRLLAHDWYSITKSATENSAPIKKERYLFLFKARILVCKVKRISEDRSVFQLKDIIKLPDVEVRDFPNDPRSFELHQTNSPGYPITLTAHRDLVKLYWLDEIRQYASDIVALEEHAADDLQVEKVEEAVEQSEYQKLGVSITVTQETTESYKTAECDITVSENLDTTFKDTVLSEARTIIVEAKRAVVIPVQEPLQAETAVVVEAPIVSEPEPVLIEPPNKAEISPTVAEVPDNPPQVSVTTTEVVSVPEPALIVEAPVESEEKPSASTVEVPIVPEEPPSVTSLIETPPVLEETASVTPASPVEVPPVPEEKLSVTPITETPPVPEEKPSPETVEIVSTPEEKPAITTATAEPTEVPSVPEETAIVAPEADTATVPEEKPSVIPTSSPAENPSVPEETPPAPTTEPETQLPTPSEIAPSPTEPVPPGTDINQNNTSVVNLENSAPDVSTPVVESTAERTEILKPEATQETVSQESGAEVDMSGRHSTKKLASSRSEYREEISSSYSSSSTGRKSISEVKQSTAINSSSEIRKDGAIISSESSSITIGGGYGQNGTSASIMDGSSDKTNVSGKPVFTKTIEGCSVEPGDSAQFDCKLSGGRTDSLTWLKDNRALDDKLADRVIASASENGDAFTLKVLHCLESDSGTYTALAFNAEGKATCTAQLVVQELTAEQKRDRAEANAPVFVVKLKDTELLEDTYLRFMIKVKGSPKPDMTFYKDSKEITSKTENVRIVSDHAESGFYEIVIEKVKYQDAGTFLCVAENKYGQAKSEAVVKVTNHKNIFGDLDKDGVLEAGEKPKFMWQRNGVYFEPDERFRVLMGDDEDTLALVFQHVKPEDAGLYTCVAQTSSGLVSCSAELTVQGAVNQLPKEPEKPKIFIEQKSCETSAGGSAMMELQITGFPRPLVTWTHDGKPIEAGTKYKFLYEDATTYSMVIKGVTTEDTGKYQVKAKNDLGTDTGEITLNVKAPPKFKSKIQDNTCVAGETLNIAMEIEGMPRPTLKIYRDGQEIQQSERVVVESEGTSYNLFIKSTTMKDTGSYSVIASNDSAQVSEFWKTKVFSKPVIIKKLSENIVSNQSDNVSMEIQIESDPAPTITWYKNDVEIKDSSTIKRTSEGATYALKITGTVSTDSARYKCVLKNEHGTAEDRTKLDVRAAPTIRDKMKNITVTEGDVNVELTVGVNGFPKPAGKWFLGDVDITEKKNEFETSVDAEGNYKLKIKEAAHEFSGQYTLKLSNDLGSIESSCDVTVNCKPKFTKKLVDTAVDEGASLTLQIEVISCPEPQVRWLRNGAEVSADARIKITRDSHRKESYNLTVDLVKYEDGGEYEVIVQNVLGSVSCKSTVTVQTAPQIDDSNLKDGTIFESLKQTYYVTASGTPIPEAEWLFNGKPIKGSKSIKITQEERSYLLEIQSVQKSNDGEYQCKLKNHLGEVSQKGKLSVINESELRKPTVKQGLSNTKVKKTETTTLTAVIVADPCPDITWSHDSETISETARITLTSETKEIEDGLKECTYNLELCKAEHRDTGTYKIHAKNVHGECDSSARLDVLLKPEIEDLFDVSAVPGERAELSATVFANPISIVTWLKDDVQIMEGNGYKHEHDPAAEKYKLIIEKVGLADDGKYTVSASNDQGETTGTLHLNTQTQQPAFITKLGDMSIDDFGTTTLHVRCDGLPKPQVKWTQNGKPVISNDHTQINTKVEAQVTSDLTINDFHAVDAGQYACVASNVIGEAETNCRVSLAQTPPSFGRKLDKTMDVFEGEPLELKVTLSGSPKPEVKWYKDGEPVKENKHIKLTRLPDGSVKLNIDKCTPEDSGAYKIVVSNPNGQIASLCAVAVTQEPIIPTFVKPLQDVSIPAGQSLKLEAEIAAFPPPRLEWSKDGVPLRVSPAVNIINQPNGKVGLEIEVSKPDHAGVYTLLASNKLGEVTGKAKVDIQPASTKPSFSGELLPIKVVEGFPAKLAIKILGHPKPTVKWSRNGAEIIPDGKHIKITEMPDGTTALVIDKCTVHDSGPYQVEVSNENGTAVNKTTLSVQSRKNEDAPEERPMFLHGLRDVLTDEGEPLVIEAPFRGNPIPNVAWTKDGKPVEASQRIMLTCDGSRVGLAINTSEPSDAGVYGCKLTSPMGEDQGEAKATVRKVYQPPSFTQKFTDLQQLPTFDAKFPCRVSGVPQPEVTWYKDNKPIHETDKYHIKRDGDASCLYVRDCVPSDNGRYKCSAKNREGSAECEAMLQVVDKIETPQKIEAPSFLKKIGDTELYKGMTGKFTACATGFPEPETEWQREGVKLFPSDRIRMETDRSGLLRLTIAGVDTPDIGKYTCRIFNEHGQAECHANLTFDSLDVRAKKPVGDQYTDFERYKSTGAPVPLSDPPIISKMTDRHLTLSWKPSLPTGPRFPVTYQIEMLDLPSGDWRTLRTGIRSCVCGVPDLEPFRDYKFRIRVENKFGISDPSPFAITYRQKLEPEPTTFTPYLPPGSHFSLDSSPYFPKDFDIERPLHGNMNQAPVFLRQEDNRQYGAKNHNVNLFWFVYGYPKPKISYTFNDQPIEMGGRFDCSYTRNGQATLFINKMLDRDVGVYEAIAKNEHGEARQRVQLEISERPRFERRLDEQHALLRKGARLEARVSGVPFPDLKWFKDWQPLASSSRIKIQFIEPATCILSINDCISRDEGLYSLTATNVAGTASSSAMIYIAESDADYSLYTYQPRLTAIKPKPKPYDDFYDLGDELGRGTQGVTYHAAERLTGRNYAAKVMHGRSDFKPFMYNELELMNALSHRKLIRLHDAYERDSSMILITELASGGELVRDNLLKKTFYTESEIAGYVRQILYGLDYMHDKSIGHFGMTIGDLLISHPASDDLKLGDFGLSRRIAMGRLAPLHYGVPEYVSPETANGEGVGLSTDMWSLGIITYILLSGVSPFRGKDDRETLYKIRQGNWVFTDDWWTHISSEAQDFIRKLLVHLPEGRMDVKAALKHPWLLRADKKPSNEFEISSDRLRNYYNLYREWYDNASCRRWFRRNKLSVADEHPSRMVYPPGEVYTPEGHTPERTPRVPGSWETHIPARPGLDYEIGVIKSESHYQYGPDTYLLQLRDTDFPVRLREYMKVAATRSSAYRIIGDNDYDWRTPIIHERRRFTDIMDEEIDDERKERITKYGSADTYTLRRLRHELGTRLDTYAEAEALIESKQSGYLPFFREKQQIVPIVENQDAELVCYAVGDPDPVVQWFKNDTIIGDGPRVKVTTDADGRSILKFTPAMEFDVGLYKVVARNKVGQTFTRTRVVLGATPDSPDSPNASQISDSEVLLSWRQPKHDGYSPVLCYSLQYKPCDDVEWTQCADNIDHEFYLIKDLKPEKNYIFRLAARNAIGWGEHGVPTAIVKTKAEGAPKIQMSRAMTHLQQLTDAGNPVEVEVKAKLDYSVEKTPIEWNSETSVTDRFHFISEISRGRFSVVVKGVNKQTDSVVAAKLLECRPETSAQTDREWTAWRSLRHERIAFLTDAFRKPDGPVAALISERLQGADVLTYLSSRHEYTEQIVATIISQVIDGLQYLHWRGYCHLNIQPDNVVLATVRSVQVKLVDLGSAQRVSKLGTAVTDVDCHSEYVAPEIISNESAFPQTDIWSVGVLAYVLLSGASPFRGKDADETKQNISYARYRFEHLYKELSQEAVRFIMLIFKRHPNKRPTAEECHENRWFMPSDFMIKKRERAVFLGNRLKEYNEQYHGEKTEAAHSQSLTNVTGTKGPLGRSNSIQEELSTAP